MMVNDWLLDVVMYFVLNATSFNSVVTGCELAF